MDSFKWFGGLYSYSHSHNSVNPNGNGVPEGGIHQQEEEDLTSAMVATMFAPRLCAFIDNGAFNPYSTTHVRRLMELCEEVGVYVPKDDIKHKVRHAFSFQTLVNSSQIVYPTSSVPRLPQIHLDNDFLSPLQPFFHQAPPPWNVSLPHFISGPKEIPQPPLQTPPEPPFMA